MDVFQILFLGMIICKNMKMINLSLEQLLVGMQIELKMVALKLITQKSILIKILETIIYTEDSLDSIKKYGMQSLSKGRILYH